MSDEELSLEAVLKLLKLARLQVPTEEQVKLRADLGKIIDYVKALQEVDTTGIEPTAQVFFAPLIQREDEVASGLDRTIVLEQAPRHNGEGFLVPTFVEEGS